MTASPPTRAAQRNAASRRRSPGPGSPEAYRDRNIVERLIGWLKECRRIFSRFEKTARHLGAMIRMAFPQRCLRLAVK
ncbi:MAG: transposase [Planctomycetes bacterium]|jgi:transposase|nr:transposase [Planctomycetota bacterium]